LNVRPILSSDNLIVARIIRDALTEFGANRPGFAWQDPELNDMYSAYEQSSAVYLVVEIGNRIVGGGGISRFDCELSDCCELQKMYLLPSIRGKGAGERLMTALINAANELSYSHIYLETMSTMMQAQSLYLKSGFVRLTHSLGQSGHNGCDAWFMKELINEKECR